MSSPFFRSPLRTAWKRWFLDQHAEFWLGELRATWSLTELRARVVEVIAETQDTHTYVLAPNRAWPGHRAGQFVPVEVEIDGVRVRRCYSISSGGSAPGARRISITVRRVAGGRVSPWIHEHLRPGCVVRLGAPAGDFVVPPPGPLLLVGGGSGLTPIMAIVRDLAARDELDDVVLVHGVRGEADALFWPELSSLATRFPGLALVPRRDDRDGYLTVASLTDLVPDLAAREIYVCGPPAMIDVVAGAAAAAGAAHRVHRERFVAAPAPARAPAEAAQVRLAKAGKLVVAAGPGSLLDQLERAGERPAHGCRMGICNTCRCKKLSGTVEDAATGAVSAEPDQDIRLCTSIARSDLTLAL